MTATGESASAIWPSWQRILFRFFFVYLVLQIAPWTWFDQIPGVGAITRYAHMLSNWGVQTANAHLFHVRPTLVPMNGSGDTSYAWAQVWLYLSLAAVSCLVWTIMDRARPSYPRLLYWLRTFVRYYLAASALSYGIIKLFTLQMPFPTLSQLATPLGDFLPMRLSWLFIGYSRSYQIFAGLMETVAGLLLLRRDTVTLGLLVAAGAFVNVVLINVSYDVPVKLFAMHLLLACVFLLVLDARRLVTFLVLNRPAPATDAYEPHYRKAWHRYAAIAAKALMILLILILPVQRSWTRYVALSHQAESRPFRAGVYDVRQFIRNGDTIPALLADTLRWRDVIFDNGEQGSVNSADPVFWQRYHRGYFRYKADTSTRTVAVWKTSTAFDSTFLFTMRYDMPDTNTILLWTNIRNDSVFVRLVRSARHFQLAERQFHWLSEYNR
ncbi:MAG: hypothetical protein M3081_10260 [Gemmatimonadota bacterium]|nr:hypothetical protein [Gemmatimonadota bacterium]